MSHGTVPPNTLVRHWSKATRSASSLCGGPGQVHLQGKGSSTAGSPVGLDHLAESFVRLVDGDEPVRPSGNPGGGGDADRWPDEAWGFRGSVPYPGAIDPHQAVVGDFLAHEQPPDDLHALLEPLSPPLLGQPAVHRDVLVGRLTTAQGGPDAAGEHLSERPDLLRHHGGVIALAGRAHASQLEARHRQGRPQPGPGVPRVPLSGAPGVEMVRAHGHVEADPLGVLDVDEQASGIDLLMGGVKPDARHVATPQEGRRNGNRRSPERPGRRCGWDARRLGTLVHCFPPAQVR